MSLNKHYYVGLTSSQLSLVFYRGHISKDKYQEEDCCPIFERTPLEEDSGAICSQKANAFLHGLDAYASECDEAETSYALSRPYPDPLIYIGVVLFDSETVNCPEGMIPYNCIAHTAVDCVQVVRVTEADRRIGKLHQAASVVALTGQVEAEYMEYLAALDSIMTRQFAYEENAASFFWDKSGDVHFSPQPDEWYPYGANRSSVSNHSSMRDVQQHIRLLTEDIKQSRSIEIARYEPDYPEDSKPLYGTLMLLGTGLSFTIDIRYLVTTAWSSLIAKAIQCNYTAMERLVCELANTNEVAAIIYAFQNPIKTLIRAARGDKSEFKIVFSMDKDEVLTWLEEYDHDKYEQLVTQFEGNVPGSKVGAQEEA